MSVKLLLRSSVSCSVQMIMLLFIKQTFAQNTSRSAALPGCEERCGNLVVRYPFGIGPNCSASESMTIFCNTSSNPPQPFLQTATVGRYDKSYLLLNNDTFYLEVLEMSVETGTIRVEHPIIRGCASTNNRSLGFVLGDPFSYSNTENRFTAMACNNNLALLNALEGSNIGGCMSMCNPAQEKDNSCLGGICCQTKFLPSLRFLLPSFSSLQSNSSTDCSQGSSYAFIVDQKWFGELKDISSVKNRETVPVVINWRAYYACQSFLADDTPSPNGILCGTNAFCTTGYDSTRSLCFCEKGYEGNPYLQDGCQDIDECANATTNSCQHICTNTPGSYSCSCKDGWILVGNTNCAKIEGNQFVKKGAMIVIATCAGLGVLLATAWWLYKVIRRRRIRKLKEKFFKKNGGLLLQQQISSSQGNVEITKLFTSRDLDKATDLYNVDRIVGQGGQGTVYKGMLTDGRIVAVKKSKIEDESKEDESKLQQFINEVAILSQINHRNIVKLHGCCLETQVPLLVYEFIPNGTLMQYIHEQNEYFPLTWDVRVRVATEIAGALYYLHSAASMPIYHRDIKSSNILLDNKYRAKVADFGTSRSISIDQTHHLTRRVQGTFGYLDPEYFLSGQFTDKSDVYSFGVVLVELLTGQKPILPARLDDEARSLAALFSSAMEENRILDILDSHIKIEGGMEEMIAFANIAYRCLDPNGRRRPTMKQVVAELESIRNTNGSPSAQQHYEENEYEINEAWESDFTSTTISSTVYHSLAVDIEPLMTN